MVESLGNQKESDMNPRLKEDLARFERSVPVSLFPSLTEVVLC